MPRNNYRRMGSFLRVEKKVGKRWVTVRTDNDWDTIYHWEREGLAASLVAVTWQIPKDQAPGVYRIVQTGDARTLFGKIKPYVGYSQAFSVK